MRSRTIMYVCLSLFLAMAALHQWVLAVRDYHPRAREEPRDVYVAPQYRPAFELLGVRNGDTIFVHHSALEIHY
jgi:hypothetical protein